MKKHYLYIGSNNTTHELERDTALAIISQHFEGFSCYEIVGYWRGQQEKTLKVEIVSDLDTDTKIIRLCKELAVALHQDAIMMETVQSNVAFIQQ